MHHLSDTSFADGDLDFYVVYRLQKFKQNGRCSYQIDSNFLLFIFS